MKKETAQFFAQVADYSRGMVEVRIEDYSGRGMMGEVTTAVVTDEPIKLMAAAVAYAFSGKCQQAPEKIGLFGLRSDDLGRDTVLY